MRSCVSSFIAAPSKLLHLSKHFPSIFICQAIFLAIFFPFFFPSFFFFLAYNSQGNNEILRHRLVYSGCYHWCGSTVAFDVIDPFGGEMRSWSWPPPLLGYSYHLNGGRRSLFTLCTHYLSEWKKKNFIGQCIHKLCIFLRVS